MEWILPIAIFNMVMWESVASPSQRVVRREKKTLRTTRTIFCLVKSNLYIQNGMFGLTNLMGELFVSGNGLFFLSPVSIKHFVGVISNV